MSRLGGAAALAAKTREIARGMSPTRDQMNESGTGGIFHLLPGVSAERASGLNSRVQLDAGAAAIRRGHLRPSVGISDTNSEVRRNDSTGPVS